MYAHQVIDDLAKTLRTRSIPSALYRDSIKFVINHIKNAKQFFLGEFRDFTIPLETTLTDDTALFLNECSPFTRLPYKICWFEFTSTFQEVKPEENIPKRCSLAIEIKPDLIWVWIVNYVPDMSMWALTPQSYYISIGKTLSDDPVLMSMIQQMNPALLENSNASQNIQESNIFPIPLSDKIDPQTSFELGQDDHRDLYVLNSALLLLNCKNIETEENRAPEKINKRRRKKVNKSSSPTRLYNLNCQQQNPPRQNQVIQRQKIQKESTCAEDISKYTQTKTHYLANILECTGGNPI